jgi:hypothetical protein
VRLYYRRQDALGDDEESPLNTAKSKIEVDMPAAITLTPSAGAKSTVVTIAGTGFTGGGNIPALAGVTVDTIAVVTTPANPAIAPGGTWTATFVMPIALTTPVFDLKFGAHTILATDNIGLNASAIFTVTQIANVTQTWVGEIDGSDGQTYWHTAPEKGALAKGVMGLYELEEGSLLGTTTTGTIATVLHDTDLNLPVNWFVGAYLKYTSGPAAVDAPLIIAANTATTITTAAFAHAPNDHSDTFMIVAKIPELVPTNAPPIYTSTLKGSVVSSDDNQPLWTVWG